MKNRELILGSESPRRREILSCFAIPFRQVSSFFDEASILFAGDPRDYVKQISGGKSESLAPRFPNDIILTADTIVYRAGKSYGKPVDEEELYRFLKELEGQWHSVFTSLTLREGSEVYEQTEETRVLFNHLSDRQIELYRHRLPWQDKAGGYMIQSAGSLMINRIEGCYNNVLGLPINALHDLLSKVGIDLWSYLGPG
ncbi:MAG: Maf family protein [Chlamydiales bacterium]